MKPRCAIAVALVACAFTIPAIAEAAWSSYFPTGTFYAVGGPQGAVSGFNYWTDNRVYRPTPHPFWLGYNNGTYHYSTDNWSTNPFYFAPSGYSAIDCEWDYTIDGGVSSLYPVTCQGFA